jgi:acetylornithine/N-succinyldiaminopimelate aminotransferase
MKEIFFNHQAQTTPYPIALEVERAEGIYIYGTDGKRYMDFISGIAVANVGHCHPKVVEAVKQQAEKYMHVMAYGEYVQSPQTELAKKLTDNLPKNLDCVYFVNSGTEATEGALKLAKRFTGRNEMVAFKKSYHGSTHGSLSVTGNETKKYAFRPLLPDVKFLDFNVEKQLSEISEKTACVIVETIQGDAGVRIPTKQYMQALRRRCTDVGALLILDEIQTGFGRTGTLFAFEQFGIVPDILTIAKAMGGGMPIGAFVSSKEMMNVLTHNPMLGHITTFGGHPVCCAAAHACLEVLVDDGVINNVEQKGALLESLIQHKRIKEIRRAGLMFAIEMENEQIVYEVVKKCQEKGLLSFWFLSCPESFRIAPPLIVSEEEIQHAAKIIIDSINECL